ncbi:LURP-one-related_family protein [Hexamita inflata]|uniref:LURP-one-related family protein n=1 Tax=Hexamita inflata TaxID=28002 RepID=A0AA86U169_9EUKA|nr:LURP-one-related family protein [Hexamita inflata]
MKFFMKQKVFSLKDKFFLTDEQATNRYYVEGDFSLVNRRKIIDVTTNTIVAVHLIIAYQVLNHQYFQEHNF